MKDEPTAYGLSFEKITDLLKVASDAGESQDDALQQNTEMLGDRLNETLSAAAKSKRSTKAGHLRHTIAALSTEPIGKLLLDGKTDIDTIRMIKEYGRRLSMEAESETEHDVAKTIYYAATAHAIVHHDTKITKFSHEDLRQSFDQFSEEKWIPVGLLDLIAEASKQCEARTE